MIRLKYNCADLCNCEPRIIATYVTNRNNPTWNLSQYRGSGVGLPKARWRIWERSGSVEYYDGEISEDGTLIGLPPMFTSNYYYDGYIELQQGCPSHCDTNYWEDTRWPS